MRRSTRPPDELHPYGHGKALYFYSLLVAVSIFGAWAEGWQFITESLTCGIRRSPITVDR
jgi:divalent metal cation (Fe/Co/Zn/Cd) transporter